MERLQEKKDIFINQNFYQHQITQDLFVWIILQTTEFYLFLEFILDRLPFNVSQIHTEDFEKHVKL